MEIMNVRNYADKIVYFDHFCLISGVPSYSADISMQKSHSSNVESRNFTLNIIQQVIWPAVALFDSHYKNNDNDYSEENWKISSFPVSETCKDNKRSTYQHIIERCFICPEQGAESLVLIPKYTVNRNSLNEEISKILNIKKPDRNRQQYFRERISRKTKWQQSKTSQIIVYLPFISEKTSLVETNPRIKKYKEKDSSGR